MKLKSSYSSRPALLVPALTPFDERGQPDAQRFAQHCAWLLAQGAHGLVVFGTSGEANSLAVSERKELLDHLVASEIDPSALMVGCGCCAITDTAELIAHALKCGCPGVLVLPAFYYASASEDGMYGYYAQLIERVADAKLRVYLYHFPQMSGVPITIALMERLVKAYPDTIVGLKDSSGVWADTAVVIKKFPDLDVYSSSESLLEKNLRAGGAGCISATANVNAPIILELLAKLTGKQEASKLGVKADAARIAFTKYPLIAALKAVVAKMRGDRNWGFLRPPLQALPEDQVKALMAGLEQAGFEFKSAR